MISLAQICESDIPLAWAADSRQVALAIIVGVEGPSYRPLGCAMAIDAQGRSRGSLSSGCLERDVIERARAAIASGRIERLRYGAGSPFFDIALPCGGGLDILIVPDPDRAVLRDAAVQLALRKTVLLDLNEVALTIRPQVRFLVFGKGPEASCFSTLVRQAGYPVQLCSPDDETLATAGFGQQMASPQWPSDLRPDARTAVTLFFHDHDFEPPLLQAALESPAFYIGAQGSLRAHHARQAALLNLGVAQDRIDRLASPFGLIPSARDARTLAVSVLAHVLQQVK